MNEPLAQLCFALSQAFGTPHIIIGKKTAKAIWEQLQTSFSSQHPNQLIMELNLWSP